MFNNIFIVALKSNDQKLCWSGIQIGIERPNKGQRILVQLIMFFKFNTGKLRYTRLETGFSLL